MTRKMLLALASGTFAAATALAQSQANPSSSPEDQLRARRAAAQAQTATAQPGETQTLSGTVKSYKAGKKIVVTDADGKNHSLKLDESARVETAPNPGDSVTVTWMTDSEGKPRVSSVATGTGATSGAPDGPSTSAPPTSGEDRSKPAPAPAPPAQPTPNPR